MIQRCYLNDVPVDVGPKSAIREKIVDWLTIGDKPRQVVTLNALMLIAAEKDHRLKGIIQKAALVSADGYGIMLALKKRGIWTERCPGVELAELLFDYCVETHLPVYCYGGSNEIVRRLSERLADKSRIIVRKGFGENEDLIREEIVKANPRLLLTGLGSPRQEIFISELMPKLKATVGIGIGGALEIISGQKSRAPAILGDHGWEWCYRMAQDPKKIRHLPELVEFWHDFLR